MPTDARRLMAQHAMTTRLLGVDFLPLGTPPQISQSPAQPLSTNRSPAPAEVELKPVPAFDDPDATRPRATPLSELRAVSDALPDAFSRLEALRGRYEQDAPHQHFN